jgi:phospholipase A1
MALACAAPVRAAADATECVAVASDSARLACFDRAYGRSRPAPAPGTDAGIAPPPATASATAAAASEGRRDTAATSVLGRHWGLDGRAQPFELWSHRPMYVLPVSVTDNVNRRPRSPAPGKDTVVDLPNKDTEAKFQVSAKALAWRSPIGDLWLAYTQSSRWQIYQGDISRPFRETNHEPELILNVPLDFEILGWRARIAGLALNHQSNGRSLPLSRSWNRVIGHVGLERDAWSLVVRPWVRLNESSAEDDNPDISDHVGRAELLLAHASVGGHRTSLRLRHTLRGGERSRGSGELEWAFPLAGRLLGFVQVFGGYGESMIDYNIRQTRVGLGFALAGWD